MSWREIPGWFDWPALYEEAVRSAPKGATIVEVGVGFGRSLAFLAREAIDQKRDDLRLVGVDPWIDDWREDWESQGEDARPTWGAEHAAWARSVGGPFSGFVVAMREHAPAELERVHAMRCTSAEAFAAMYASPDGAFWLAFIDGDHKFDAVQTDIALWRQLTIDGVHGGTIAGHDYAPNFPGVVRAVDEAFRLNSECNVKIDGSTWFIPWVA
jgi:hypothetical protein